MAEGAGLDLTAAAAAARRLVRIPLIASPPPAISARRLADAARPASAGAQCPGAPGAQRIHSDPVHLHRALLHLPCAARFFQAGSVLVCHTMQRRASPDSVRLLLDRSPEPAPREGRRKHRRASRKKSYSTSPSSSYSRSASRSASRTPKARRAPAAVAAPAPAAPGETPSLAACPGSAQLLRPCPLTCSCAFVPFTRETCTMLTPEISSQ